MKDRVFPVRISQKMLRLARHFNHTVNRDPQHAHRITTRWRVRAAISFRRSQFRYSKYPWQS